MNYETACYELGIDKSIDITIELLKKQYKMQALRYHPDKNDSPDSSEKFQRINNAYQYLLKRMEFIDSDDDEDYDEQVEEETKTGYRWVLYKFLKNILTTSNDNMLFYKIIEKISTTCENKSLETLEKIDKQRLIKIYEILNKYKHAFHFSNDFFNKVDDIIKRKIEGDECIILNPTIDDLFENNLYKLKVDDITYIIPLWHHELVYDHSGNDLYVKCNPILDNNIRIDDKNNIHIDLVCNISDILGNTTLNFNISKRSFSLIINELRIIKKQRIILYEMGISKINTNEIYNISKKSDIIVNLELL
jgi:hypothetical protein